MVYMLFKLLWTFATLHTGESPDYTLREKKYYDDYAITLHWLGQIRWAINCRTRIGSYYNVTINSQADLFLVPTTWPCDRTAELIIITKRRSLVRHLKIRRRFYAKKVTVVDEGDVLRLGLYYSRINFENDIPVYFIVSTTIIHNQRNVTLPDMEVTTEPIRILKKIRPGKYVFQIKAATDEENREFLAPSISEHIENIDGVDLGLKVKFDDPTLHVTWEEHFYAENKTLRWQCFGRNGTAVEDNELQLEESIQEVSQLLSPRCYNATITIFLNRTVSLTSDDGIEFIREQASYAQTVSTGILRRKISAHGLKIDIAYNRAVLEWQVKGEEYFPERSYVVRRKDSNCGLPDIETSNQTIEWSFTKWPKMYEINVEPKVPAIDVHRSVPISGEITLNAPEFKFGLMAQFDDPFLHLSWQEPNASETVQVLWECYDSDGKFEENSEETDKMSLVASLSPGCYNVSATLQINKAVVFGERGEKGKGELTYSESVVVDPLKRKIKVYNLTCEIDGEKIVLKWKADAETHFPERKFLIRRKRISRGNITPLPDIESFVESTEWTILKRPEMYDIKVEPIVAPHEVQRAIRMGAEITVNVLEALPTESPTNVEVNPGSSSNQLHIDFQPLDLTQIPGEDVGCLVYVCDQPDLSSACNSKFVGPRVGTATYYFLQHARTYYTAVACGTRAGWGPPSPWIEFQTGTDGQATTKSLPSSKTLLESTTKAVFEPRVTPINECTVKVSLEATHDMNTIIQWRFRMSNGSAISKDYIDDMKLILHRRDPTSSTVQSFLVTEDKNVDSIDLGLSPKYKFDLNCYSYELKATIRGGIHVSEATKEICFTRMSPSFITIYIFTLIIVGSIGVAVLKKYRDRQVNIRAEKKEDLKEESKTLSREDTRKPKKTEKIANKEKRDSKESSK